MRTYLFNEFNGDHNVVVEWTEEEILDYYWKYWHDAMVDKYGHGHRLITRENCVEDFVIIHWAWEKK